MELYIGGYAQGKLEYVLKSGGDGSVVEDIGEIAEVSAHKRIIFHQFQDWFRREVLKGMNPEEEMGNILKENPNICIISNETGCGIIPAEAGEREYRERLGRYLCRLAAKAERVERVVCGIGQRIK